MTSFTVPQGAPLSPFGVYIHVPFCASRCGYCDFNTYTVNELSPEVNSVSWLQAIKKEITVSANMLESVPPLATVFFGGGTPSLIGASTLVEVLDHLRATFGLVPDCEITTECNPEFVDINFFHQIRAGGFTRVSLGMQSYAQHILQVLDRRHSPDTPLACVQQAYHAGFEHISVDLIYGTPGESNADWLKTIDAVLAVPIDHISAYALIVEDGTALARKVRSGTIVMPNDDVVADRYEIIDNKLHQAGFRWYEISNWSKSDGQCRHNMAYWRRNFWWGYGPGAHSFIHQRRWWNHKHPRNYNMALLQNQLPVADYEDLSEYHVTMEHIMLSLRLAEGLPFSVLNDHQKKSVIDYVQRGYAQINEEKVELLIAGRLIADAIIADLIALI